MYERDLLPEKFAILGTSRTDWTDEEFRQKMKESADIFARDKETSNEVVDKFLEKLHYTELDFKKTDAYDVLKGKIRSIDQEFECKGKLHFLHVCSAIFVR